MNQIRTQNFHEIDSLDAVSFFYALIREGSRLSLLNQDHMETLQLQLMQLLTEQFNRWTGGSSSSVSVETGERIQQSVLYTIGYYLKGLIDPELALEELKSSSLEALFLKGKQRIEREKKTAESLMFQIQGEGLMTDLIAYHCTLSEGLPMFFRSYDVDFGAHETPASIDYPLAIDRMELTGIDYIAEYLRKLQLENHFCGYFSNEEIHDLLRGYDRQYKELLINVFTLVFFNAVGAVLLGRSTAGLSVSEFDREYLQSVLSPLSTEEMETMMDQAVDRLCCMLSLSDEGLVRYMKATASNLKSRLRSALESGGLRNLFLSLASPVSTPSLEFEDKAKLDDDSFRRLSDRIRECRYGSDKIALLREASLGISDLVDLLEGDCFFGEEYQEVFRSLEELKLAMLVGKLPLDPAEGHILEEEAVREWQAALLQYLNQMSPQRRSALLSAAAAVGMRAE